MSVRRFNGRYIVWICKNYSGKIATNAAFKLIDAKNFLFNLLKIACSFDIPIVFK